MINRTISGLRLVLLAVIPLSISTALAQQPVTLGQLLEGVESHPELEMRRAAIEAAEAGIPMRSSLMDPSLILGVQNVPTSFSFTEDPMTAKVIGIEQMFPFPGKLSKERSIGEFDVRIARIALDEARNTLRKDVKLSWYDILHRQRSIDVNLRHVGLLEDFKKEIAVNVAYGKSPLSQLDQLELEQAEIERMIAEDSAMIAMQFAKLHYLTGMEIPHLFSGDTLAIKPLPYSMERLMSEALAHNPTLQKLQTEIERAGASKERSDLERYPDFDVMLMYMQRSDLEAAGGHGATATPQMDMLSAQLSITLPFVNYGGAKDAQIAEIEAMRKMKLAEARHLEREIQMMLTEKVARLAELRRKNDLFTSSVLPSLDTRIRSYFAEYQFDKSSLQTTITQLLNFMHMQHEVFELESEYQKTIAEIDFIIGTDMLSTLR